MHCGAKTRTGAPCKSRAMNNGRCRMHGGNGAYKHGYYTNEAIAERRQMSAFIRDMREALDGTSFEV